MKIPIQQFQFSITPSAIEEAKAKEYELVILHSHNDPV